MLVGVRDERRAVGDEQIFHVPRLTELVEHRRSRIAALPLHVDAYFAHHRVGDQRDVAGGHRRRDEHGGAQEHRRFRNRA